MSEAQQRCRPKNIVLCSDGTGNSGGKGHGTNVWKVYRAVDRLGHKHDSEIQEQICFYDDGVGTEDFKLLKLFGGAFGWGLSRNIRELYTYIVKHYEPGDRIYLFGFSRGAFTIRSLAGMICDCGILDRAKTDSHKHLNTLVKRAFKAYRNIPNDPNQAQVFREQWGTYDDTYAPEGMVEIEFIGIWDTVDAVGVPVDELRDWLNKLKILRYRFHDHELNRHIKNGCHALAIDDERHAFHPLMWNEKHRGEHQTIEQVWFAGVHSNVGGGYPRSEMSLVSLDWMLGKAEQDGLRFIPGFREQIRNEADVNGKLYDSRSGFAAYYRYAPRDITQLCQSNDVTIPKVHVSVFERIIGSIADYAPTNLPGMFKIVPTDDQHPLPGEDSDSVEHLERHMQETHQLRVDKLKRMKDLIRARTWLYRLFLVYTMAILATSLYFMATAPAGNGEEVVEASWLAATVSKIITYIVPGFLQNFVASILEHPIFTLIVIANLLILLDARRRLKSRIKNISLEAWQSTLPPPLTDQLQENETAVTQNAVEGM